MTSVEGLSRIIETARRLCAERQRPVLIAIDGRSGVGKSALAAELAMRLDAAVVSGDDFFAGGPDEEWARRAPEERADRCIDWRRLRREALEPLLAGRTAVWRPFYAIEAEAMVRREPRRVIVLDGVYSGRPELADLVDLAVLVEMADDGLRRRRLIEREGETFMAAWHAIWDAAEDHYFIRICPRSRFDYVMEIGSPP